MCWCVDLLDRRFPARSSPRSEVMALASFDDTRHIVRYYNAWVEEGHLYIQMEKMDYSLDRLVGVALPQEQLLHIFRDCLTGLRDIHAKRIVHLDVKVCLN
ncbi:MAG: hypothetical protein P4L40_22755 [Terracidiphilus sp.]|nr:hypothetical protein [Terracidiphilus sp.]